MPKTRPPSTPEFRRRLIELVRKGRSPEEVARQFEPSAQTIRNWLRQAARDAGRRTDGPTTAEREELRRVPRDIRCSARSAPVDARQPHPPSLGPPYHAYETASPDPTIDRLSASPVTTPRPTHSHP